MKKNKGFTLIEILVVIGIIAILAAVVLIAINPARQFAQARDSQRVSAVNTILNAVGQYIADNKGNLPSGITLIQSDVSSSTCYALTSTYVAALPTDPKGDFNGTALSTTSLSRPSLLQLLSPANSQTKRKHPIRTLELRVAKCNLLLTGLHLSLSFYYLHKIPNII